MNKHIIRISILAVMLMIALVGIANAQGDKPAKSAVVKIKTSAQCGECKERIEGAMAKVKGIEKSDLNVDSKILTVNYNPEVVKPEEIKKAVTKVGYDADEMPANPKAYKKLSKCCQKPE